jgi:hypothetical protein
MEKTKKLVAPIYASLALAFAGFGDTFLYPFLPLNSLQVGIPVFWVGLILSANRFIRILLNSTIVNLISLYGMRTATIVAVLVAVCTTVGYAFSSSVLVWVIFRIVWGLCYSALRITSIGYALKDHRPGFALGLSKSLQETGAIFILAIASLFLQYLDAKMVFVLIAAVSLPSIYFAWKLPIGNDKPVMQKSKFILQFPSTFNAITFATTFLVEGVVVLSLGILLMRYQTDLTPLVATTMAAGYFAYRRICSVILSTAGGWIADKIGIDRAFTMSLTVVIFGLILIVVGWVGAGALVIFTFYSINSVLTPASLSRHNLDVLSAVSENATWRDIGAAVGALAGGFLLTSNFQHEVLLFGTFGLIVLLFMHVGSIQKMRELLFLWK